MSRMCGIGAIISLDERRVPHLPHALAGMGELLAHRGPDGEGEWMHERRHVGFANRRLRIIDLERGDQPMHDGAGNWITYNGEIYNHVELRRQLGGYTFRTTPTPRSSSTRIGSGGSMPFSVSEGCSRSHSGTSRSSASS